MVKKVIKIEGMSCGHCTSRVETLLNEIEGVHAKVSLEDKEAVVEIAGNVSDERLAKAVKVAGFEVTEIKTS